MRSDLSSGKTLSPNPKGHESSNR